MFFLESIFHQLYRVGDQNYKQKYKVNYKIFYKVYLLLSHLIIHKKFYDHSEHWIKNTDSRTICWLNLVLVTDRLYDRGQVVQNLICNFSRD